MRSESITTQKQQQQQQQQREQPTTLLMRTLEPHKNMTLIFSRAGVAATQNSSPNIHTTNTHTTRNQTQVYGPV